ncbi:MAG: hypothetical protein AAFO74_14440 [Pseudomonadota bacterium]
MVDTSSMIELPETPPIVSLDEGIVLIESGKAPENICVDIGHDILVRADGSKGLQGLLQRLRGHRMVMTLASGEASDSVVPMRSGKPDMHPDVAEILDALKDQG